MANIRMRNGRKSAGFAFEATLEFGSAGQMGGKDFDRDAAIKTGVTSAVDFAHAASADGGDDFVGAEPSFRRQVHDWRRLYRNRTVKPSRHRRGWNQQASQTAPES